MCRPKSGSKQFNTMKVSLQDCFEKNNLNKKSSADQNESINNHSASNELPSIDIFTYPLKTVSTQMRPDKFLGNI